MHSPVATLAMSLVLQLLVPPDVGGGAVVAQSAPTGRTPAALVDDLTQAMDRGKLDSLRRTWGRAHARAPGDPVPSFALATLDRLDYRHAPAEQRFAQLAASPRVGDDWRLWSLLGQGSSRVQRGDVTGGGRHLSAVALRADSLGDGRAGAEARLALVRVTARSGRLDSTRALLARARSTLPDGDPGLAARVACTEATVPGLRSLAEADSILQERIERLRPLGVPRVLAPCLVARYQVLSQLGLPAAAARTLDDALATIRETADIELLATILQQQAFRYIQFTYGLANGRRFATEAIRAGRRSGNRAAEGYARLNLAQLAIRLGDPREASQQAAAARTVFEALGDQPGLAALDFVAGDAAFASGRLAQAREAFERSLQRYRQLGSLVSQVHMRLAMLATAEGRLAAAESLLAAVAVDASRLRSSGLALDLRYHEALLALTRGEYERAAEGFRDYARRVSRDAPLYRFDAGLRAGEALVRAGRLREGELVLDSAFAQLEAARRAVRTTVAPAEAGRNRDVVMSLAASRRFEADPDLGVATTIAALARGGREGAAFRVADLERARMLWVRLARRGLLARDSVVVVHAAERWTYPAALPLDSLQRALDARTALVLFSTGAGGEPTTVFLLTRSTLRSHGAPSADSLVGSVERLAQLVSAGEWPRGLARSLGAVLLDSTLARLPAGIERLVVVPDGPLHRVPFDALLDPRGEPLAVRFALSLAPSARLAVEWLGRPAAAGGARRVVALGDARFDTSVALPRLPGSGEEARVAAGGGRWGEALVGRAAREAVLARRDWRDASILHLATHARTEEWGILSSAVYLTPGDGEDGRLDPTEIEGLSLPVDLVVLSGCRTNGGAVVFGEGNLGLVAPFLEAGARAVLATLWELPDRQAVPFLAEFYRELQRGATVGDALHRAKRVRAGRGDPPRVWATFALTGDAGVRPLARAPGEPNERPRSP